MADSKSREGSVQMGPGTRRKQSKCARVTSEVKTAKLKKLPVAKIIRQFEIQKEYYLQLMKTHQLCLDL